ncbi:MAG TPA: putative lipid II flippase FtsW [Candidatus Paceibacterota bacterium]
MQKKSIDKFFLSTTIILIIVGFLIFLSASLGILAKNETKFYGVLFNQLLLGLGLGILGLIACSRINYKFWRKYSFWIFLGSVILTLLVFIPGLGFSHGGAKRWIEIGSFSFQPVEFLKFGFIIYFAAWLSAARTKSQSFKWSVLPFLFFLSGIAFILFKQPDTKSFILILITGLSMIFISGVHWKYIIGVILAAVIGFLILVYFKPYLLDRVDTFLNPSRDPQGSSYQLQQSLIAIGSGGILGRGFGQSVQKFSYLPEPQGDSVFAVLGEEFGFAGGISLIALFSVFALRGLRISSNAPDLFARLLSLGIVILLIAQAFMNIASIIGLFPLTGVPLPFVSHGGTALMIDLVAVGIVFNISKFRKNYA